MEIMITNFTSASVFGVKNLKFFADVTKMGELKQNEIFEFDKLALSPQSATKQLMKQCEEVNQTLKEKQLDNLKRVC